ncbi:AtpZ/AtpI family protein [Sedimentibacter sp. zth1]|uniref:AtpZ/AtpI family protein n=1 Tax=Sedimentibacter sp. zth1 TaxID=2816908 RepID=UPI001A920132|nr:AtpZ/AtpI family protein [Sedimentibacter sp. zth1]QSX05049.1 AtpZ/AtpI family protein [Sedimentibacter sp. zth1]
MSKKYDALKNLTLITQVGLIIVTSLLVSIFLGNIIDRVVKTEYIFKIIFILFGIASGFTSAYKLIMKSVKK